MFVYKLLYQAYFLKYCAFLYKCQVRNNNYASFQMIAHVMGTRTLWEEVGPNVALGMASLGVMLIEESVMTRREPGNMHGARQLALVNVNKIILQVQVFSLVVKM